MQYGSLCSGVEAAALAWHVLGWQPQFFSEIEVFCCRLLQHRFPSVPNFGDMTKFKEWPNATIDLLVGGTPCQAFSVAGLRQGLADPRGNLALVYLGVLDRYRPRWCVWENVPGVLSSSGGRDFGAFLGALAELGYGFAYRVLDAQNFGVPQRRRRVFVVGHLGDWRRAAAVLLERQSMRGDSPTRKSKGQTAATFTAAGAGTHNDGQAVCLIEAFQQHGSDIGKMGCLRRGRGCVQSGVPFFLDTYNQTISPVSQSLRNPNGTFGDALLAIALPGTVRQLTPLECERLQGMPDNWTLIPGAKDSHRYKAIGNSMAVPVMRWIGEGIVAVDGGNQASF